MAMTDLNDLFVHELKDLYDAEQRLVEALPDMAEAATDPQLATAFREHLEQTREHVNRLESVFRAVGEEAETETCEGMKGLITEGSKLMEENADPAVTDAALIAAAQRVEHYEIAAYGTLRVWAATLGIEEAAELLEQTLEEEKAADEKLSRIAEGTVNIEAETEESELEPEEAEQPKRPARATRRRRTPARTTTRSRATKPARSQRRKTRTR